MAWEHLSTSALMKNVRVYEYALKCKLEMSPYTLSIRTQPLPLTTLVKLCYHQWHTMLLQKKEQDRLGKYDPTWVNLRLVHSMKRIYLEILDALECYI